MNGSKLAEALSKAQAEMSGAKKDKQNPFFKSSYADLSSVFEAIKLPFAEHGLAICQTMDVLETGRTVLITRLMHSSGEHIESKMLLPDIHDPQKIGSAITYFRRYSLMAIAGIAAQDDDDDGCEAAVEAKAASLRKPQLITKKQVAELELIINGYDDLREEMLSKCQGDFATLTVEAYPSAVVWAKKEAAKRGKHE